MLTTIKINKTDSGWPASYEPSSDEIKAYFLGWRLCDADGAPYVSGDKYWHKWTDLSGITDTCPTTSYVGSERHLAIVASDTPEEVEVDIDTDLRIFSGDNYIGADVPAEIDLSWTEIVENIESKLIATHKYLIYIEGKANASGVLDITFTATNGVITEQADPFTENDTAYVRRYLTITPAVVDNWQLSLRTDYVASTPVDYSFRKPVIIDLTTAPDLPLYLQEYFEVTSPLEMSDTQLVEYYDSIGFVELFKSGNVTVDGVSTTTLTNSGKNILIAPFESGDIDDTGDIEDAAKVRSADLVPINSNTEYIFSNNQSYTTVVTHYYDENEDYIGYAIVGTAAFTTPNAAKYTRLVVTGTETDMSGQLEEGSSATTYVEPRLDSVLIPVDVEFLAINDVFNELDVNLALFIKRVAREEVVISSGEGTLPNEGTGSCLVYDATSKYTGTVSGTTVTTTAPDNTYYVIYELAEEEYIQVTIDRSNWTFGSNNQLISSIPLVYDINGTYYYAKTDNYVYNRVNILEI